MGFGLGLGVGLGLVLEPWQGRYESSTVYSSATRIRVHVGPRGGLHHTFGGDGKHDDDKGEDCLTRVSSGSITLAAIVVKVQTGEGGRRRLRFRLGRGLGLGCLAKSSRL